VLDDYDDVDEMEEEKEDEEEENKKNMLWPATFVPWCCSDEIGSRFLQIVDRAYRTQTIAL
jgi:hypothetical protein